VTEGIIQFKSQPADNLKIPRDMLRIRRAAFCFEKSSRAVAAQPRQFSSRCSVNPWHPA